ncbi:MAG: amino acid transporter [Herbiconiux sp.]|uniref:LysE/ArgO family amino acid transporter n=1 Tax=Herbiconiux sp. TaxID=1871186 RepID=UPI001209AD5B|nr:LysE/ArgO family amino acid transporter [Herbiconiux sp.]TAJ48898.1 MAG: amino acid transporter [Herbiconiux sp.]
MTPALDPLALVAGLGFGLSLIVAIGAQNAFVLRQGLLRRHVFSVVAVCAISDIVLIGLGIAGVGVAFEQVPWLMVVARAGGAAFLLVYAALAARRALRPTALTADDPEPDEASDALVSAAQASTTAESRPSPVTTSTTPAIARPGVPSTPSVTPAMPQTPAPADSAQSGHPPAERASVTPLHRSSAGLLATVLTCVALTWLNPHVYLDTVVLLGSVANTHGDSRWLFGIGAAIGSIVWFSALGYGARFLRPLFARPAAWRVLDGIIALMMAGIAVSLLLGL